MLEEPIVAKVPHFAANCGHWQGKKFHEGWTIKTGKYRVVSLSGLQFGQIGL